MEMIKIFQMKIVIFTPVKNRCMLHRRVFVMFVFASLLLLLWHLNVRFLITGKLKLQYLLFHWGYLYVSHNSLLSIALHFTELRLTR